MSESQFTRVTSTEYYEHTKTGDNEGYCFGVVMTFFALQIPKTADNRGKYPYIGTQFKRRVKSANNKPTNDEGYLYDQSQTCQLILLVVI